MIEAFSAYIKTIAIFIIFSAFAEIIMPNENFKKYVHIVIGFLMIVIVLKPITTVLGKGGLDFTNMIEEKEVNISDEQIMQNGKNYEAMENEYLLNIYKQNMIDKITSDMEQKGIYASNILLTVGKQENNFGELLEIEMTVSKKSEKQKSSVLEVKPVEVIDMKQKNEESETFDIENEAIEILKTQYHVASESIHIIVQ